MVNPKTMRCYLHFNGVRLRVVSIKTILFLFHSHFHVCFWGSTIFFPGSMLWNKSILPKSLSSNTLVTFAILLVLCFILLVEEGYIPFVYEPKSLATSYLPSQEDPFEDINNDSLGVSTLICQFNGFRSWLFFSLVEFWLWIFKSVRIKWTL